MKKLSTEKLKNIISIFAIKTALYGENSQSAEILSSHQELLAYRETGLTPEEITALKKTRWIPVTERMPEEHESIFAKFKGTDEWDDHMFMTRSDYVLVTFENNCGEKRVGKSCTYEGDWKQSEFLNRNEKIIAWMSLPKPYEQKGES